MKLFGEEVNHTSTNSLLNVISVENFEEIFFGVYEVELNEQKYPLEKISDYRGNAVVQIPIIVEGEEVLYPFVLIKGPSEILFNESNIDLPIDDEYLSFDYQDDEILSESKQEILEQIEKAKEDAKEALRETHLLEKNELLKETKKNNNLLKKTLETARENLVNEFISISDKLKIELVKESNTNHYELKETIDNKLVDICEDLETQLKDNFNNASDIFDKKIKSLVKELYAETVSPRVEQELNDIALQIVEKVGEIEIDLGKKLDSKAEKTLVEGVSQELSALQKANIELNDNINKNLNKALSRTGNVKTLVEKIDKELHEKINSEISIIEKYFDERITNIQEKTFDVTEESRKYILELVNKTKTDLLEEIRKIPTEKPVEYIIESKKKDPEKVNLDKLKKEYDTIIHNKFENYKTDLRKYISVYSGGGSVAVQFADGGVMNGDLTVVGSISASQYLGIPIMSGDYLPLSGGEIDGNVVISGSISASQYLGLPLIDTGRPITTFLVGDGSTSIYAISGASNLTNASSLIVSIDGALQEPENDYTLNNNVITFTSPLLSAARASVIAPHILNLITEEDTLDVVTSRGNTTSNTISVSGITSSYVQFDTTATPLPNAEGLLQWNATDGTLDLGMQGGAITMQIGQELFTKVRNESGYQTIPNGSVVYISGRTGIYPNVRLAKSDIDSTSRVLGITTEDITSPGFGYVTTEGYVRGIKTNYTGSGSWGTTWNTGDMLYVSSLNAGVLTNVEPPTPHHSDIVGSVGVVSSNQGTILVIINRHVTLQELSDVNGTAVNSTGQFPVYHDGPNGYFDFDYNINNYSLKNSPYVEKTANYTVLSSDNVINCTSNSFTVTLPTAVGIQGRSFIIKNSGTGVITLSGQGSQTIDSSNTVDLTQFNSLTILSTNANWIII